MVKKQTIRSSSRGVPKTEKSKSGKQISLLKGILKQLNIPTESKEDELKNEAILILIKELSVYATKVLRVVDQAIAEEQNVEALTDMLKGVANKELDIKLTDFSKSIQNLIDSQDFENVSIASIDVLLSKINIEIRIAKINEKQISTTMIYLLKLTQLKNLHTFVETAHYAENSKSGHKFLIYSTMASLHLQLAVDPDTEFVEIKAGYSSISQSRHREIAIQFADKAISILREQRFHLGKESLMLGYASLIPLFIKLKDEGKARDLLLSLMIMKTKYPGLYQYPTILAVASHYPDLAVVPVNRVSNTSPNSVTSSSDVSTPSYQANNPTLQVDDPLIRSHQNTSPYSTIPYQKSMEECSNVSPSMVLNNAEISTPGNQFSNGLNLQQLQQLQKMIMIQNSMKTTPHLNSNVSNLYRSDLNDSRFNSTTSPLSNYCFNQVPFTPNSDLQTSVPPSSMSLESLQDQSKLSTSYTSTNMGNITTNRNELLAPTFNHNFLLQSYGIPQLEGFSQQGDIYFNNNTANMMKYPVSSLNSNWNYMSNDTNTVNPFHVSTSSNIGSLGINNTSSLELRSKFDKLAEQSSLTGTYDMSRLNTKSIEHSLSKEHNLSQYNSFQDFFTLPQSNTENEGRNSKSIHSLQGEEMQNIPSQYSRESFQSNIKLSNEDNQSKKEVEELFSDYCQFFLDSEFDT